MVALLRVALPFICLFAPLNLAASPAGDILDTEVVSANFTPATNNTHDIANSFQVTSLSCYYKCNGIDRSRVADALNWFCNRVNGHTFNTPTDNFYGIWTYQPENPYDEGQIVFTIDVTSVCQPAVVMDFNTCWANIMRQGAVDRCNMDSTGGKQGGTVINGCLQYEFQPNPKYWPSCQTKSRRDTEEPPTALSDVDPRNFVMKDSRVPEPSPANHDVIISTALPPQPSALTGTTGTTAISGVGPTYCFNNCFGVSRKTCGEAADYFCASFRDRIWTTPDDNKIAVYTYNVQDHRFQGPGWTDEGVVQMTLDVLPEAACDPPMQVPYNTCYQWFMNAIIDQCNTGGVDGKQGGWVTDGCLNYTINPNPRFWPDCQLGKSKSGGRSIGDSSTGS